MFSYCWFLLSITLFPYNKNIYIVLSLSVMTAYRAEQMTVTINHLSLPIIMFIISVLEHERIQ